MNYWKTMTWAAISLALVANFFSLWDGRDIRDLKGRVAALEASQ